MSLHYLVKLEMLIGQGLPMSCYRKKVYPTSTEAISITVVKIGHYCNFLE